MIELLHNAIIALRNDTAIVEAVIKDDSGQAITTGSMKFIIEELGVSIDGEYDNEADVWCFLIPKMQVKGRYFYFFKYEDQAINFPAPIYFK